MIKQISIYFYILTLTLSFLLGGCSSQLTSNSTTDNSQIDTSVPKVGSNSLVEFDQKLSKIHDESSAIQAVDHFANHVINNSTVGKIYTSSNNLNSSISIQSKTIFSEKLIKEFASVELKARTATNEGLSIQSLRISETNSGGIIFS